MNIATVLNKNFVFYVNEYVVNVNEYTGEKEFNVKEYEICEFFPTYNSDFQHSKLYPF